MASEAQGLEARLIAAGLIQRILLEHITIDDALEQEPRLKEMAQRDRSFVATLLLTTFRHRGEIEAILSRHLAKPLPRKSGPAALILWLAVTQLIFLDTPAHAAIDMAVRSARADRNAVHFSGLINAVLRKIAANGKPPELDAPRLNTPEWLWKRWVKSYGGETAHAIAAAHMEQPSLDVTVRADPETWAERLGGELLPTGQIRLSPNHTAVTELSGFEEGAWWIQDAAAALPVRLLGDLKSLKVLDLCAAPGGKTLQLCAGGAQVTAMDISSGRLQRVRENLQRTGFSAEVVESDVLDDDLAGEYDAVLLDAPCSATGTIRRHPELPYLKDERQIRELVGLQARMLVKAATLVRPGGRLLYCTCSLEREEGEKRINSFLKDHADFSVIPAGITGLPPDALRPEGWIRLLPSMGIGNSRGMDGFFMSVMRRQA